MNKNIYLDYASTTPMDERVLKKMLPYFSEHFGNASSNTHKYGWQAKTVIKKARKTIASNIAADDTELIFTASATESINIALKGVFDRYKIKGKHIISCVTEHQATLDTLKFLESQGAQVTYLPVNQKGLISLDDLENSICPETILINIMWVNNETGVIQDIPSIGKIAKKHNVLFACDATQAFGKFEINVKEHHIGLLTFSAHKIYGPKGIGGLFVGRKKPRATLSSFVHGGGQEKGIRAGTLNTPGIVGFEAAFELLNEKQEAERIALFSQKITQFLVSQGAIINGSLNQKCPHIINARCKNKKATELIKENASFCFSLGSACTSESLAPSHVLKAMGLSDTEALNSFRISIGRNTTKEEIEKFIADFSV